MGVSIYYTWKRQTPLSQQEQTKLDSIIQEYNESFPFKEIAEDFCIYDPDPKQPEIIITGSTKLPLSDDLEDTLGALAHWIACLTDIRKGLTEGGEWSVNLDDTDIEWDDEEGWTLPM